MDFTAPPPERLFFSGARAVIIFVRNLNAVDWVLIGVITTLVVPIPVYRHGAARGIQGLLALLTLLFTLVNIYVLVRVCVYTPSHNPDMIAQAASWDPNIVSPENSTIALVDISNFLSPIAADTALLYNTILDDLALDMTFRQIALSAATPCILKVGRLLDSLPFVRDRIRLVL